MPLDLGDHLVEQLGLLDPLDGLALLVQWGILDTLDCLVPEGRLDHPDILLHYLHKCSMRCGIYKRKQVGRIHLVSQ